MKDKVVCIDRQGIDSVVCGQHINLVTIGCLFFWYALEFIGSQMHRMPLIPIFCISRRWGLSRLARVVDRRNLSEIACKMARDMNKMGLLSHYTPSQRQIAVSSSVICSLTMDIDVMIRSLDRLLLLSIMIIPDKVEYNYVVLDVNPSSEYWHIMQ